MTKIDDLIETLVGDLAPVSAHALRARLASAFAVGILGAVIALLISLGFRHQFHQVTEAAFWVKFIYTAVLMVIMMIALNRVARPEGSVDGLIRISGLVFGAVVLLAVMQLMMSPASSYNSLIFGHSASFCPLLILAFGFPAFLANMWFLRKAAPMNAGLAGFIGGACAGALGGWVYSWACTENGMPFISIWYTIGILLSGLLGHFVGRRSLRW